MSIAIKIENLSKQYRLGLVSTRTLSHDLNRWWQTSILGREDPYLKIGQENKLSGSSQIKNQKSKITNHKSDEYVWALRDINLEVEEGEVLGIIGKNGAGKSTLLKILSKVTAPTTGIVKARGRIASLLEVGTGFHSEMTGRENIYMNGAIMGMTKAEIRRKFDEIVDFAGVERYIDTPVKRYSSGMTVRLGFAVAAHLEPEILVVDEVLAVGDAEFQRKAVGKMQEVSREKGRTVLFVSHNMNAIQTLCNQSLLLDKGNLKIKGDVKEIIKVYLQQDQIEYSGFCKLDNNIDRQGAGFLQFNRIEILNEDNINTAIFNVGDPIHVILFFSSKLKLKRCSASIVLQDYSDNNLIAWRTHEWDSSNYFDLNKYNGKIELFTSPLNLLPGVYNLSISFFADGMVQDLLIRVASIKIIGKLKNMRQIPVNSIFYNECKWRISQYD